MKRHRLRLMMLVLGAIVLGGSGGLRVARAEGTFVAKFGTATLNDAQHIYLKNFAAALEKDSAGRIKVEIYPASQLGSIPRMIEQTQFGSAQLWIGPPEFLAGVDERFELLAAPGVFRDMAEADRVLQDPEFSRAFLGVGERKGLVGVGLFLSAPNGFAMRSRIASVAQFAGLKIRVLASPMQTEQIRALQATAVPMSLGEVLPALQQGALDGVLSAPPVITALKYMSAAKYLVYTQQAMTTSIAVMSRKWLQSLPEDLRRIVLEDGRREAAAMYPTVVRLVDECFATWREGGGEVIELAPEEKARLAQLMAPVPARVVAQRPEEKPLYDLLLAAARRSP